MVEIIITESNVLYLTKKIGFKILILIEKLYSGA